MQKQNSMLRTNAHHRQDNSQVVKEALSSCFLLLCFIYTGKKRELSKKRHESFLFKCCGQKCLQGISLPY